MSGAGQFSELEDWLRCESEEFRSWGPQTLALGGGARGEGLSSGVLNPLFKVNSVGRDRSCRCGGVGPQQPHRSHYL